MNNWSSIKIKYLFDERNEKGFPNEPLLAATQSKGVVKKDDYENRTVVALKNLENLKLVEKGDFVISLRSFQGGIEYSYDRGIISTAYTIIKLKDGNEPNFFKYYFKSHPFVKGLTQYVTGIRQGQNINYSELKNSIVNLPSLNVQKQIVKYLDRKTAQIDELIDKKKRKIELLKEKRTALINHVVTKGLDENADMKDSGVEWIGEIPSHWDFPQIRHYMNVVRGGSPRPSGDPRFFNGDHTNWITVKEVTSVPKYIVSTEAKLTKEGRERSRVIEPETLLLTNSGATLGVPGITKIEGCINDGVIAFLNMSNKVYRDYLFYFWSTQTKLLFDQQSGYGQPNLNTDLVSSIRFPLPPYNEQERIVEFIQENHALMDLTIHSEQQKIDLLIEYRQSLISEVVTGKIDVREEVTA